VDHAVEIPRDTHTGLPTGQRIHKPLTITKQKDQASPLLFKACCTGENMDLELDHYRIKADGTEEKYFTIKVEDGIVVDMREITPTTFLPDNKVYSDMEEVSFTYSKITWTYNDGNVEFTDDWKA
jgi:type VI secretion system secreted protein Hcp